MPLPDKPLTPAITEVNKATTFIGVIVVLLSGMLVYGAYEYRTTKAAADARQFELAGRISELEESLVIAEDENEELRDDLRAEKRRNNDFEDQIEELSGTVSELDKLRKLDPQLLKKYSKIAFLNENYLPERLVEIDEQYLSFPEKRTQFHAKAWPYLEDLLRAAKRKNLDLRVVSAYRSFGEQATLKTGYQVVYGSGANQFSADQGYSEHQLGTTIDFSTAATNGALDGFELTPAYQWLLDNAYKYGFVLSYPPGNAYYQFEPWHWRFVGIDLADDLRDDKKYFYDLDQREIDTYLLNIFD